MFFVLFFYYYFALLAELDPIFPIQGLACCSFSIEIVGRTYQNFLRAWGVGRAGGMRCAESVRGVGGGARRDREVWGVQGVRGVEVFICCTMAGVGDHHERGFPIMYNSFVTCEMIAVYLL